MKRVMVLGVLVGIGGLSLVAAGFQGPPAGGGQGRGRGPQGPPVAEIEKVKDNLYEITGGGGNSAAFITEKGVVLVDTKLANWGQAILDKIKTVTDKPVIEIINTHTHGDHTGSNEFFGTTVEIVAHENTKTNMEKMDAFKGDKSVFLPKKTFKDRLKLGSGKEEIDLYYFGPAHTNGDAWVVFKDLRVMHAGDAFAGKTTPIVDTNNGGSVVEYGKTLAKAAKSVKNVDEIITGHANVRMKMSDLQDYADFNDSFVAWVRDEIKAGKTLDQAVAEYKVPPQFESKGFSAPTQGPFGGVKSNITAAYNELGKK
jgi:glyoxylase-like metal-dependent hydrolase (beta-lactamase superfamily II)